MDNTFEEKALRVDANKLRTGKESDIEFEPMCVFTERKGKLSFFRGTRKLVFYVDGAIHAIRFGKTTDELQTVWTKKEAKSFVEKEIAKAHEKITPFKMWQFVIIVALLVIILLYNLMKGGSIRFNL